MGLFTLICCGAIIVGLITGFVVKTVELITYRPSFDAAPPRLSSIEELKALYVNGTIELDRFEECLNFYFQQAELTGGRGV